MYQSQPRSFATTWFALLAIVAAPCVAAGTSTEVVELRNRPASEVIPLIRPFLAADDAVSGTGFQLILRTSSANLAEIRKILASIDRTPRRLLISVRQADARELEQQALDASGTIAVDENAAVTVGDAASRSGRNSSGVDVHITRTRSEADEAGIQKVQVLEGHSASISIGQSIPVMTRGGTLDGRVRGKQAEFAYRDVSSGFAVIPRLNGNRVTLEIRPQRADLKRDATGTIATQQMHSTVSGPLGEWFLLGGVTENRSHDSSGYVFTTHRSEAGQSVTMVRVEELPE